MHGLCENCKYMLDKTDGAIFIKGNMEQVKRIKQICAKGDPGTGGDWAAGLQAAAASALVPAPTVFIRGVTPFKLCEVRVARLHQWFVVLGVWVDFRVVCAWIQLLEI